MLTYIKYLEIPYVEDGRGWKGCDCYGLFLLWYEHELGIEVYDFQFPRRCDLPLRKLEELHESFVRVTAPRRHDLVLMRSDPRIHIGVCVSEREFIHTLVGVGGAVSDLNDWAKSNPHQTTGFYRHRTLI